MFFLIIYGAYIHNVSIFFHENIMRENNHIMHGAYIHNTTLFIFQENPMKENNYIFNVGNPNYEVKVKQLPEIMNEVSFMAFQLKYLELIYIF